MSYHISQDLDLTLFVRNLFFCKNKSCSAGYAQQLSPLLLNTFSLENLTYHILRFLHKSWYDDISAFERKTCSPTKTEVVQLIRHINSLGYSEASFPQKTWLGEMGRETPVAAARPRC